MPENAIKFEYNGTSGKLWVHSEISWAYHIYISGGELAGLHTIQAESPAEAMFMAASIIDGE